MTDDLAQPTAWQIPLGVSIGPGEYLLFWADNDEDQGDTHTNFKLDIDGEYLALVAADGVTILSEFAPVTLHDIAREGNEKLVRRHPHVFGQVTKCDANEVARNWAKIKKAEMGLSVLSDKKKMFSYIIKLYIFFVWTYIQQ